MYLSEFASGEFASGEFAAGLGDNSVMSMAGSSSVALVGVQVTPADLTAAAVAAADFFALQLGVSELACLGSAEFAAVGEAKHQATLTSQAASYVGFDGQGDPVWLINGTSAADFVGEAWAQAVLQAVGWAETVLVVEEYPVERSVDMAGSAEVQWAFTYVAGAPLQSDGGATADFAGTSVSPVDSVATLAGSSLALWRSRQQMSPGVETAIRPPEPRSVQRPYEPRSVQRPEPD